LPADTSALLRVTAFDTERGSKRVLTGGQFLGVSASWVNFP
tara:strand:- start:501 stop:623 length:123 start_codon:yes stop_codon:yes gene_type:complete